MPADSQTSICSVELYEEVNEILTRNKFTLSPFKLRLSVDATSLPNYVNRKRKQLLDTFYEETDCKIRKLYYVSSQKLEFNECKICDEWNENLSLVLENENLSFIEKVRLMTVIPSSLSSNYILLHIRGTTDYRYMIRASQKLVESKGLYEKPDPYSGNPVKTEVIELVERYYLDDDLDYSRQSPNKNDVMNVKINGVINGATRTFAI